MTTRSTSAADLARMPWGRVYVGLVIDNVDPDKLQRVKVVIPSLMEAEHKDQLPWVAPIQASAFGIGDNFGVVSVPYLGSRVLVIFQDKDQANGLYVSGLITSKTTLQAELLENYPYRSGWCSPKGDIFYQDSQTGQHFFRHFSGSGFTIEPDGSFNFVCVGDRTDVVKGDYVLRVEGSASLMVDGDLAENIGGDRTLTVSGSDTAAVSGTSDLVVAGARTVSCSTESRSGPMYSSDDVVASGISLVNHPHGGIERGSAFTDPPS